MPGKNQGRVCFYCMRVFEGYYKHKGKTITTLEAHLADTEGEHTKFVGLRLGLIQKFKDGGTRLMRPACILHPGGRPVHRQGLDSPCPPPARSLRRARSGCRPGPAQR